MNIYTVYQHINNANGKRYIGITSNTVKRRWNNGLGYRGQSLFWNAIQKYGWDGFTHEIIATDLSKEEAEAMEVELIAKYDTTNREKGYNQLPGGDASRGGWHHSEETKQILREKNGGENAYFYGKKFSESHVQHLKDSHPGQQVRCVETGVIYNSIGDAAKAAGLKCKTNITTAIKNPHRTAGGYHWEAVGGLTTTSTNGNARRGKPVRCVETGEVFESRQAAAEAVGLKNGNTVGVAINNPSRTAGGYHWENVD